MPGRIASAPRRAWEIAASVAVMILATALMIPLAARIYAATVMLRPGPRSSFPKRCGSLGSNSRQ